MRTIVIGVLVLFLAVVSQAQYQWTSSNAGSKDLRTAKVLANGDIYVFGDSAFAAKSSDNGQTWSVVAVDSQYRTITACGADVDQLYVAGKNGLSKYKQSNDAWVNNSGVNFQVEKIVNDDSGNAYFFPRYIGLGACYETVNYTVGGTHYSMRLLHNFYLPIPGTDMRYVTGLAKNGRIVSCLHNTNQSGQNGALSHIFISDDKGSSWRAINFSFPAMTYVNDISFNGNVGHIVGANMSGAWVYIYESIDNGETWNLINTVSNINYISKSVYSDFDGLNYHGIAVGLTIGGGNGFILVDNNPPNFISSSALNFVTGNNQKIVVVGDSGKVFIALKAPVGINKAQTNKDELVLFPNPSAGVVNIKSSEKILEIKLFTSTGQLLQSFCPGELEYIVNISNYPSGIYFIQINGRIKKLIKE